MSGFGSQVRRIGMMLALVSLAACNTIYRNHGYIPQESDLEKIVVGEATREDVARYVGRPSSSGVLAGSGWYYVGSQFKYRTWHAGEEVDRQVVAISFDENGTVSNVERFGLERGEVVVISRRVTDSNIKGLSFLRQLLGNLGSITAADLERE